MEMLTLLPELELQPLVLVHDLWGPVSQIVQVNQIGLTTKTLLDSSSK